MMINRVKRQMDLGFPVWEFFVNGFSVGSAQALPLCKC